MKSEIKHLVNRIFGDTPASERASELKEEIYLNLCDRYDELIKSGKSDYEAMEIIRNTTGDFTPLLEQAEGDKNSAAEEISGGNGKSGTGNSDLYTAFIIDRRRRKDRVIKLLLIVAIIVVGIISVIRISLALSYVLGYGDRVSINGLFFTYNYQESDNYLIPALSENRAEATVDAGKVNSIDIDWIGGNIRIVRGESGSNIKIIEESDYGLGESKSLRYNLRESVLTIKHCKPFRGWGSAFGIMLSKNLTVYIPDESSGTLGEINIITISASVDAELDFNDDGMSLGKLKIKTVSGNINAGGRLPLTYLDVRSVSGNITARNFNVLNYCDIYTVSGIIKLEDFTSGNVISLETVSGDIKTMDTAVSKAAIKTTSGKIYYSGEAGQINCKTVSGDVDIIIPHADNISVGSTSGEINLSLYDSTGFSLDFESISGHCESRYPATFGGNKFYVGDGSCIINVKTASGDLNINDHKG